jgi:hypothetical protein
MQREERRLLSVRAGWWGVLWLMLASAAFAGQSSDQQFLAGLRERGLFELAETYCLERLQRPDLPEAERADVVIELSRCLAERAVSSPPDQREPLWQRASRVTQDFAQKYPEDPRLPLVRLQQALCHLARGELARQEAQLAADQGALLDEARTHLRVAVGELRELADAVQRQLREQNRSGQVPPSVGPASPFSNRQRALSAEQLTSLQNSIQYELARALRNQAECYASDSPDRANSLTQAVQLLTHLAKLDLADPLSWKSRIDLIVSQRLLADYNEARRQLDALWALKPPPPVQLRAQAERIRLALATGQLAEAISVLSQGREIDGQASPELDYAWLETYLAAGRAAADAHDNAKAHQWQAKATEMVERIEQLHGPYWTRRAGMLLSRYVRTLPDGGDLDMQVRGAESSFRSGRLDDALAAYDRAAALAAKEGKSDRAFELGYVAATIEHQRGRHEQALDRYRRLAMAMPDHPQAAEAHLLAIYHAAQIAKQQRQGALDRYIALLQEHLRTWPTGPSADRVRWQWGRVREHRRDWQGAIRMYQAVSPGDAEYLQVAQHVEACYRAWLAEREAAGQPNQSIAGKAADWFESMVTGPQGRMPERWSPLQQFAVLAAARFRLNYTRAGYRQTYDLLSAALRTASDAPPQWKSAARGLLIVSLAGQGRSREAGQLLPQMSLASAEELLSMLEGLERVASGSRPEVRGELAQLQLNAIKLLPADPHALSQAQRQAVEKIRAQALADAGRTEEALHAYQALAEAYPRDGALQEAYARLLLTRVDRASTETDRKQSIETALEKWRELEKNSPSQSPRWFLAKYWVARLHFELGNKRQAAKIITLLEVLHPELGGPEMKPQFEELLRRCQQ